MPTLKKGHVVPPKVVLQAPPKEPATNDEVEFITPVPPQIKKNRAARSGSAKRNLINTALLILALVALLIVGGALLHYLKKNPVYPPAKADKQGALETEMQTKPAKAPTVETEAEAKPVVDSAQIAIDKENAEQNLALKIDPANATAQRNLKRAANIETVLGLIRSGREHEEKSELSLALADYEAALKLDAESDEARKALKRIKGRIAGEKFRKLMATGLTAYRNKNYQKARSVLLKAKSLRPNSNEVKTALTQVDEAIGLIRIQTLQQKAGAAERAENWQQALASYQSVLNMDTHIQFAVQGKARCLEQIRTAERINFYLQKPEALESDRHLENAILLLYEATEIEPRGPRLTAQLEKLDNLVKAAQTPVKITLESDNLTEVAVYKVARLGRFAAHELMLRPGSYTVVGARKGYQDVRRKIVVKAGQKPVRVTVVCRVKI